MLKLKLLETDVGIDCYATYSFRFRIYHSELSTILRWEMVSTKNKAHFK